MSTKREPLLSDDDLIGVGCGVLHRDDIKKSRSLQHLFNAKYFGALQVRDHYESARAKDAELIQMLVDALDGCSEQVHHSWTREAINAAAAHGFKPSEE